MSIRNIDLASKAIEKPPTKSEATREQPKTEKTALKIDSKEPAIA